MADSICNNCGKELVDRQCLNPTCRERNTSELTNLPYGSFSPASIASLNPSEIVDYTGTIGTAPGEFGSQLADGDTPASLDENMQTRMVDDDFYQQIQSIFPGEIASGSAGSQLASKGKVPEPSADFSRSVNLRDDKANSSVEAFIPPIREIKFPSDTVSLDKIRELDPETIEGDEYHITEQLGEGGYGVVFEANQMALNRPVAIKVLKPKKRKGSQSKGPSRSGTGTGTGELQRRRDQFLHEAKITARLQHPNIVPLYDFGINSTGQLFYSMKKVERRPWSSILHKPERLLDISASEIDELAERQAISRNIEIFSRVCEAIAYAHSMKVVHRDLKPDNIMVGNYGEVLLIDFGMALDLSTSEARDFSAGGTLVYMAPEMAEHFSKQKEIQLAAQKTAKVLGVDRGTVFLDQSNVVGVGSLAQKLIKESKDRNVVELAETLIRLDAEEKELANKIDYSSDIYLLGAILYQIAVGHPPHYFPLSLCKKNGAREKFQNELWLALKNGFQKYNKIDDPLLVSLREIAIQAMRTNPADRFQSVEELQNAIRGFQKQVQSFELAESGKEELAKAKHREDYQHLLPALESFRAANELWPQGDEAIQLGRQAACEYAKRARKRRDYDAGLSILDEYIHQDNQQDQSVVEVRKNLILGKRRSARNRRLAVLSAVAAVLLPLSFFVYFSYQTASVIAKADAAEKAAGEAEKAAGEAEKAAGEAEKAKQDADKLLIESRSKLTSANEELALVQPRLDRAAEVEEALSKLEPQLKKQERELELAGVAKQKAKEDLETATEKLEQAKADRLDAEKAVKMAKKAAEEARRLASKFQFDADFRQYNSNVLTIPLDFRTSKRQEAAAKLRVLEASNAKPRFKNGWLVKYFSKQIQTGESLRLADGASVALVNVPGTDNVLAIGDERGSTSIWKINTDDTFSKLPLSIPQRGDLATASISADGSRLALAYHAPQGAVDGGGLLVIDLADGTLQELPNENLKKLVGCKYLQFSDSDANRLVAVEEIKGFHDLKQRLHVVEYRVDDGQLQEVSRSKIRATNRTEERIGDYLASVYWEDGAPTTVVAYRSLDESRAGVGLLEVVSASSTSRDSVRIERFPTALLMGADSQLYCGHRDGSVDLFDAENLAAGPSAFDASNPNGNEITVLSQLSGGGLLAGSKNGHIVIWQDGDPRRIDGVNGKLKSLVVTQKGRLLSGSDLGTVHIWKPATIDLNSVKTVTCGAIDQSFSTGPFPASAYGTNSGEVAYFNSNAIQKISQSAAVKDDTSEGPDATFRFKSPFASFDNAFDDFDSMGILDDWFVVMKNDGTLVAALIDKAQSQKDVASSKMKSFPYLGEVIRGYAPLIGSTHNQDYFYSNDPSDEEGLLRWRRVGSRFVSTSVVTYGSGNGQIKRLVMSPDGQWLAVVRLANRQSGEYQTEISNVDRGNDQLRVAKTSTLYRVGDPAFVGFSEDSRRMIFHRHTVGTDRKTYVESWNLEGSTWVQDRTELPLVADQKVDLIDWSNTENIDELVTRFNRSYFLKPIRPEAESSEVASQNERRLRNVLSSGIPKRYYVLTSSSLSHYDARRKKSETSYTPQNARDMRVYGDKVVVLDQVGFHLFNKDLQYVTKIASRKASVESVSLSGPRLAICYDNQLCRIWDVSGDAPEAIGAAKSVTKIELSPDGKWAACIAGQELKIFDIRSQFDAPKLKLPTQGAIRWSGKENSTLILASPRDKGTDWIEIDPMTGASVARNDFPKNAAGVLDFQIAPLTENFVAIREAEGMSLWATGDRPVKMTREHEFDAKPLQDVRSISFSEIVQQDMDEIGTRMVILAGDGVELEPVPRIYLLARQLKAEAGDRAGETEFDFRVVEIEGALESNVSSALKLESLQFSGDSKSLLKVHNHGASTLLSAGDLDK